MAHKMHHMMCEMYYGLLNGFPERLNTDCHPRIFKFNQANGGFLLEPLLLNRGDAINLSLLLVRDKLSISQAPGRGFHLSLRYADMKLQSLPGSHVCLPVSLVFGGDFH